MSCYVYAKCAKHPAANETVVPIFAWQGSGLLTRWVLVQQTEAGPVRRTHLLCLSLRWKGLFLLWIGCTEDLSWSYCQVGCNKKVQVHSQMSQSSRTLVTVFYSVCFRTKCYILRLLNGISWVFVKAGPGRESCLWVAFEKILKNSNNGNYAWLQLLGLMKSG